jgi:hypothetical protein
MHHSSIEITLSKRHWHSFHAVLLDRRRTIDDARRWLNEHGYSISRSAIGRYRRMLQDGPLMDLRRLIDVRTDADARRIIRRAIGQIEGRELAMLAVLAGLLAGGAGSDRTRPGVRLAALPTWNSMNN